MNTQIFQILNLVVILVVFVFLIRYAWDLFFSQNYSPVAWQCARKAGRISQKLERLKRKYPDKIRFYNFWFQVERLKHEKVPGDFAEAGVYQGDSACVIHQMDTDRILHLFDTFSGFTEKDLLHETGEASAYTARSFADTHVNMVKRKIGGNENISVHEGYFPDTAVGMEDKTFALVNLDLDLYVPTKAALEFFYPRLSPGGVILIHDYNPKWEGICKAVNEFILTQPEPLILVPDLDGTCMIIRKKEG